MSDTVSVYIKDGSIDPEMAVAALPSGNAVVVKSWETCLNSGRSVYHGYAFVSRDAIEGLRHYVRVNTNKNVYPRKDMDNPTALYVKFTPNEKIIAFEVLGDICSALKLKSPSYTPMNGYGFINFESVDFVPVITGLLRRVHGLELSTIRYGRLSVKQANNHNLQRKGNEESPKFAREVEMISNNPKPRKPRTKKANVADEDGFIKV